MNRHITSAFLLTVISLVSAAEQEKNNQLYNENLKKPGHTIVSCSNKDKKKLMFLFQQLWKTQFSYSCPPTTVTLDIKEAETPEHHIVADLSKPIPLIKDVRDIYMERPNTYEGCIDLYVKHLMPSLPKGGALTIEWHPFIYLADKDEAIEDMNKNNPFTGHFIFETCKTATLHSISNTNSSNSPKKIGPEVEKYSSFVNELLNFYATKLSTPLVALQGCLRRELVLIAAYRKYTKKNIYIAASFGTESQDINITQFNEQVNKVVITDKGQAVQPDGNCQSFDIFNAKNTLKTEAVKPYSGYVQFNPVNTLFNLLWSDIAVMCNKQLAIERLQQHNLNHLCIWRGNSDVNKRDEVWLLRGFK